MNKLGLSAAASRYNNAAKTYNDGRLNYGAPLIRKAIKESNLSADSIALDLGCGPGTIANEIAKYCGKVIAVDPSIAMLEEGKLRAPGNVQYIEGTSADLSFIKDPINLATFGRSFHWMDQEQTLEDLDAHMAPSGILAFFYVSVYAETTLEEHQWWRAILEVAKGYSDGGNKGLEPPNNDKGIVPRTLLRSKFSQVSYYGYMDTFNWTVEKLVAWIFSRFATGRDANESMYRECKRHVIKALLPYGKGPWPTVTQQKVVIARRPE